MVSFTDGSEDYIDLDKIGDKDILLLWKKIWFFWSCYFFPLLLLFLLYF